MPAWFGSDIITVHYCMNASMIFSNLFASSSDSEFDSNSDLSAVFRPLSSSVRMGRVFIYHLTVIRSCLGVRPQRKAGGNLNDGCVGIIRLYGPLFLYTPSYICRLFKLAHSSISPLMGHRSKSERMVG